MHIEVVDFRDAQTHGVADFNRRLLEGGQSLLFPASTVPEWLPKLPGRKLFQEYYLAADDDGRIRGGYLLKHQEFRVGGKTFSIGDFQLPISEGVVNRTYAPLGAGVLAGAERRTPLLYSLGMGPLSEPLPRLLAASGWRSHPGAVFLPRRSPRALPPQQRLPAAQPADAPGARRAGLLGRGLGRHQARPRRRLARPRADRQRRDRQRVHRVDRRGLEDVPGRSGMCACGTPRRCGSFTLATTPASSACASAAVRRRSAGPCC